MNPATPWVNDYVQSSKWPQTRSVWILKFDHKVSAKNQMFVRANSGDAFFNFNYDFPGIATPGRNVVHRPNKGVAVDDTYLISPSTVLDVRVGFAYGKEQQEPYSARFDLASLGFPQSFVKGTQFQNFPTIGITGFATLVGNVGWKQQPGYNYSLQSNLSMQRGKHLIKTGIQFNLFRGTFSAQPILRHVLGCCFRSRWNRSWPFREEGQRDRPHSSGIDAPLPGIRSPPGRRGCPTGRKR